MFWTARFESCATLLVSAMHNLVDLDKYQGLQSSSDDVVLSTLNEIVARGNWTLAKLLTLLGAQVTKSDVTALSAGLAVYALALKASVHDPSPTIIKGRADAIGIPAFAALNAIPKLGLIVSVALEFGYATPRPYITFTIMFAAVVIVFFGFLIFGIGERSVCQLRINGGRDVEEGDVVPP
ncbi:hypothetical protein JAAARDRAFT_41293 [Jaapia argillacea MUCL 33604]|uniref:Uncharacterized protein n=1 Tax=Jaapia argillacea MUCL 33604 TaxID=933084 RepID=A0A067PBL4_9AGAM|nr:hypothetical protein JAAARDRAFT_41293 [Jaapia argillacea MUCL 33604]